METVGNKDTKKKMIPIIKLEYYDDTQYLIRADRDAKDIKEVINLMSRKKGDLFLQLSIAKQIRLKEESFKKLGGLVRMTTNLQMEEEEFLKVKLHDDFVIN